MILCIYENRPWINSLIWKYLSLPIDTKWNGPKNVANKQINIAIYDNIRQVDKTRLGVQRYHKQSRSVLTRSSNYLLRKVHWKTDCAHGACVNASKEREKEREAVAVSCALIITAYMKAEVPHDDSPQHWLLSLFVDKSSTVLIGENQGVGVLFLRCGKPTYLCPNNCECVMRKARSMLFGFFYSNRR